MNKTRTMVLVCFLVAFAAGTAVGLLIGRSRRGPRDRSRLTRELNLTPAQRKQMRKIWSDVMSAGWRQRRERSDALQKERDEAVKALLSEEQKAQYEEVMQGYSRKIADAAEERGKIFQTAVERTKQILTDAQRKKYEELLEKRPEMGPRHRRGNRKTERSEAHDTPRGEE